MIALSFGVRYTVYSLFSGLVSGISRHMANLTGYYENDLFSTILIKGVRHHCMRMAVVLLLARCPLLNDVTLKLPRLSEHFFI